MKDTVDSFAQTSGEGHHQNIPIDLDLEATDPLAKHEVTFQFAAFRALSSGGDGGGGEGRGAGVQEYSGGGSGVMPTPTSLYFTYQFYTCLPTRTERMLLRPDGPKDRLYQVSASITDEPTISRHEELAARRVREILGLYGMYTLLTNERGSVVSLPIPTGICLMNHARK